MRGTARTYAFLPELNIYDDAKEQYPSLTTERLQNGEKPATCEQQPTMGRKFVIRPGAPQSHDNRHDGYFCVAAGTFAPA